jgi:hypothetical protein
LIWACRLRCWRPGRPVADHLLAGGASARCPGARLCRAGAGAGHGEDGMFRDLVLARIIEPVTKPDSARVLEEAGARSASYPTVDRHLRVHAKDSWRGKCPRPARRMPGWARPAWSSTTCPRCISRPAPGTGPRTAVLQRAPPGPADHHRPAHRHGRVPADGRPVQPASPTREILVSEPLAREPVQSWVTWNRITCPSTGFDGRPGCGCPEGHPDVVPSCCVHGDRGRVGEHHHVPGELGAAERRGGNGNVSVCSQS